MPKSKKSKGYSRYAPYIRSAANLAYRGYKSFSRNRQRGGGPSEYLSTQHDARLVYRRKRMPRKKRRRWVSFKKRVQYVSDSHSPRQTLVHTDLILPTCLDNQQAVCTLSLYPAYYTPDGALWDIQRCQAVSIQTGTEATQVTQGYRFRSAVLEALLVNRGTKTMYIDCYWAFCKKDSEQTPQTLLGNGLRTTATAGADNAPTAIGFGCTENTLGVTPFQSTMFCQYYKIWKKTRYILGAGNTIQLEWRDPKDRLLSPDGTEMNNDLCIKKGWTKTLVFVAYTAPSATLKSQAIGSGDLAITRYVNYIFGNQDYGSNRYVSEY